MNLQRQIDRLITERAGEWLETLRSGKTEEYPQFVRWLGESPRHMKEFLALLALEEELPGAFARAAIDRDALLKRIRPNAAEPLAIRESLSPSSTQSDWHSELSRRVRPWSIAAAAVVAGAGLAVWMGLAYRSQSFSTAIGEQRTVTLADGSIMELNASSSARVKFADGSRDIHLTEGEALFQVAHDSLRPFRVRTKDAVVEAIGTRFNVDTRPTRTVVSVLEGQVEVSTQMRTEQIKPEPLSAGETAEVTREGKVHRQPAADAAGAAAWRQRQLVFSKTALEDVAAEFNRFHRKGRLLLEDIEPGSHHYTGTFNADDVASFAELLGREPDLSVEEREGDYIVRRRTKENTSALAQ